MVLDSYGSTIREKMKVSMSEPAPSTTEKFQALNRRRKHDRIYDKASKWVLYMVWIALGTTIIAQVALFALRRHHG